jgi:outer membrane protein OmpA-like peptidoglycan-associated protein
MKTLQKITTVLFFTLISVYASVDNAPISAGTSTGRNISGSAPEAPAQNPALLGCERPPIGGLLLFPITNYGVGYWSDKLALSPLTFLAHLPTDSASTRALVKSVLRNSFDLTNGMTPDETSKKMSDKLKGGASIYGGFRTTILSFTQHRFSFDVTTHMDNELNIPEAPFFLIMSLDKGFQRGNKLDFSNFKQEGIWATDFSLQLGLPVTIPVLQNFFKLRYGAGGLGVKYIMGHSMLNASSSPGSFIGYDSTNNAISMDGKFTVQTAGAGLHGPWEFDKNGPFGQGLPVNGHGIGVDIGGILYDDFGAMSINFQNLGVLFWTNNVKTATYDVKKDNLDLYSLINGINTYDHNSDSAIYFLFGDKKSGETFPTSGDTLDNAESAIVTVLPLALNIGYSRIFDLSQSTNLTVRKLADFANVEANYMQQLVLGPGCSSYIPRISIGAELGTLHNFVPLRMGFIMGGPERWGSALGMGFNFKYFSLQGAYKAIGNWWFVPTHGFALAGGLNVNWGYGIDSDKDGIIDSKDKCPHDPEDIDGFEDEDGCPDFDNDKDGIPDLSDKCPNVPEDKDGFQDEDGCPDYDNDLDGVPDSVDKCPDVAEDKDNFQDNDGCPDYDNDADGVPDSIDMCPITPEDIDLFEDEDGCPDFDNDKDGIPDSTDKCPMEPEVYNGYKDDDGCPDTLIKPTEKEIKILNTRLRDINFKTGSAELLPVSFASLDYIVGFLQKYPNLRYEIQGHTDNVGGADYNLLLSAARAGTVRAYLLSKSTPDSNLIAIGYGKTRPIADNKTVGGRALNRRVEFRFIESVQEYSTLKVQEEMFREKIKAAKIKGSDY